MTCRRGGPDAATEEDALAEWQAMRPASEVADLRAERDALASNLRMLAENNAAYQKRVDDLIAENDEMKSDNAATLAYLKDVSDERDVLRIKVLQWAKQRMEHHLEGKQ